jgi:hypothetical protein
VLKRAASYNNLLAMTIKIIYKLAKIINYPHSGNGAMMRPHWTWLALSAGLPRIQRQAGLFWEVFRI